MVAIELDHVTTTYDGVVPALDDLDLHIDDGRFFSIVGPSGCGKTTLLRVIAGLERPVSGSVRFDGRPMDDVEPSRRDVALMFQSYALYPNMTVAENLAFPLRVARTDLRTIHDRVEQTMQLLGLTRHANSRPSQLSGGERQRVSLGRAIIRRPRALLLDEPLSNLDAALRIDMRAAIHRLHVELGMTTVHVTHDQEEATAMADTTALMRSGRVVQCGPPLQLRAAPADLFTATFFGTPAMSVFAGRVELESDGVAIDIGRQRMRFPAAFLRRFPDLAADDRNEVAIGIRPDAVRLDPEGRLTIDVERVESLGHELVVHATIAGDDVIATDDGVAVVSGGVAHLRVLLDPSGATELASWRPVRASLDPMGIHLFDLHTGRSLAACVVAG